MILVGTSGYHFKAWYEVFYPRNLRTDRMLAFYATHFDTVELNFTFYRLPSANSIKSMMEETPEGFLFCVKLNQELTHKGDLSTAPDFIAGVEPLLEGGRLGAFLAQFPQNFRDSVETRRYLSNLRRSFSGLPLVAEFRHSSWQKDAVFDLLAVETVAYCCVDLPPVDGLPDRRVRYTAEPAYIRLHSRNSANWYRGEKLRYDYSYSEGELREWAEKLERLKKDAKRIFVFFNNCERGQAPRNALTFLRMLKIY